MQHRFRVYRIWSNAKGIMHQVKSPLMSQADAARLCRLANAAEQMQSALRRMRGWTFNFPNHTIEEARLECEEALAACEERT